MSTLKINLNEVAIKATSSKMSKVFRKSLEKLPLKIQSLVAYKYNRWRTETSSLNFERKYTNVFAVDINGRIHAICTINGNEVFWEWIGDYESYIHWLHLHRYDKKV